jgi:3-hydroxyacyl-[acyl-carrier-protein] dehydratase
MVHELLVAAPRADRLTNSGRLCRRSRPSEEHLKTYTNAAMSWIECLPHQPPMRLLEDVVDVKHGESATGRRLTRPGDFYFQGHFPDQPVVPAIILVEMLAQTGGIAAAAPPPGEPPSTLQLRVAAIGPFKFPAAAGPDMTLEARARVAGRSGRLFKIEGTVTADGVLVATGSLTLAG